MTNEPFSLERLEQHAYARRHEQAIPGAEFIAGNSRLVHRWNLREDSRTFRSGDRQRQDPAGFDVRERRRLCRNDQLQLSADKLREPRFPQRHGELSAAEPQPKLGRYLPQRREGAKLELEFGNLLYACLAALRLGERNFRIRSISRKQYNV